MWQWLLYVMTVAVVTSSYLVVDGIIVHNSSSNKILASRRSVMVSLPGLVVSTVFGLDPGPTVDQHQIGRPNSYVANAVPTLGDRRDRRQLELCLVNILRLQYWAISLSEDMKTVERSEDQRKRDYLEARLGSKVMVAVSKKIGGGATTNVFMLKTLQLTECLDDLKFYAGRMGSKKQMDEYKIDLIEALASIVEFDGLETTQDPSPRSALTLQMYTDQKGVYVQRMLSERVVPLIDDILRLFGPDAKSQSVDLVAEFYPKEVPTILHQSVPQTLDPSTGPI
jgi:hypothetical protein